MKKTTNPMKWKSVLSVCGDLGDKNCHDERDELRTSSYVMPSTGSKNITIENEDDIKWHSSLASLQTLSECEEKVDRNGRDGMNKKGRIGIYEKEKQRRIQLRKERLEKERKEREKDAEQYYYGFYKGEVVLNLRNLAKRMCPVFYFDSQEKYFPMDVEDYIEQCVLRHRTHDIHEQKQEKVLCNFPLEMDDLKDTYRICVSSVKTEISKNEHVLSYIVHEKTPVLDDGFYTTRRYSETLHGVTRDEVEEKERVPLYCHILELDQEYRLLYCIFFPYVCGKYHRQEGYWTYVSLYLDKETLALTKALYRGWNQESSYWLDPNDLMYEKGHPLVFLSRGSHCCYPYSKTWKFGLLGSHKEYCNKHIKWCPDVKMIVLNKDYEKDVMKWMEEEKYKRREMITQEESKLVFQQDHASSLMLKNQKQIQKKGFYVPAEDNHVIKKNEVILRGGHGHEDGDGHENGHEDGKKKNVESSEKGRRRRAFPLETEEKKQNRPLYTEWIYYRGTFGKTKSPFYKSWFNFDDIHKGKFIHS